MSVLDEFNSSELIRQERDIHFQVKKLFIFENDPLSKHRRIACTDLSKTVTLFNKMIQN